MSSKSDWAQEALVRAGAAFRCHAALVSTDNDLAVRQAVHIARMHPGAEQTSDEAELILLETYLRLESRCPICAKTMPVSYS